MVGCCVGVLLFTSIAFYPSALAPPHVFSLFDLRHQPRNQPAPHSVGLTRGVNPRKDKRGVNPREEGETDRWVESLSNMSIKEVPPGRGSGSSLEIQLVRVRVHPIERQPEDRMAIGGARNRRIERFGVIYMYTYSFTWQR